MRDPRERVLDMLDAISRIEEKAKLGREEFQKNDLVQVWMVHHLQIVGEAAAKLGRDFHAAHPETPWEKIVAMRNVLVHDYFGVDREEVWTAVERDLPGLRKNLEDVLKRLKDPSN